MNKYEKVRESINGGMKVTDACKLQGVSSAAFYVWRSRLRRNITVRGKRALTVTEPQPVAKAAIIIVPVANLGDALRGLL